MSNTTDIEKLFLFRDQFCCIQLIVAMVSDNELQITTSSIYPGISGEGDNKAKLKAKLKDLYYLPNSVIQLAESNVLLDLVDRYLDEPSKLSSVVMSDDFASLLVDVTGSLDAEPRLKLLLGNANYRCAFSNTDNLDFVEQTQLADKDVTILSSTEQGKLALLIHAIASDKAVRDDVIACTQKSEIVTILSSIKLANAQCISMQTAGIISDYLSCNDVNGLTTFLGSNTYKASW
ncbi:hypothetical protein [Moritella sp.]|uniref:hypothetical protein n=1 Tax=Moritella sp. TaxID=78556 RepID=UPI001D7E244A|nr:hypothetical protein [Moritella sp.]MCJ8350922.1 hypothetical protein [Moritella sp.]NQZ40821.1 hypothetical protein [Moritella sp.]